MILALSLLVQRIAHPTRPDPCDTYQVTTIRQLPDGTYATSERTIR